MSSEEKESSGMRLDRYLWHVRLSKTRSQASKSCQSGDVKIEGERVKPSRQVHPGDEFQMKRMGGNRVYRVIELVERRLSAKEVPSYLLEITPQEELDRIEEVKAMKEPRRERGTGRPTKKELRMIRRLFS